MEASVSGREKNKSKRLDRIKQAVAKGEEPSKFYHNIGKTMLLIPLMVMMGVWVWVMSLYSEDPEMMMPVFILGMAFMIPLGTLTGVMEYWLYERETPTIKLGHLPAIPFIWGEWKATVKVPYQSKTGDKLVERWEVGRVGCTKWMWSRGGGKKGYYAVRILDRIAIDETHNPLKIERVEPELAGLWEGNQYRVPIDCSLTYPDRLKEEIARKLRSDKRFRQDSPIYAGELALPERFQAMEALTDMQTKIHDRDEHIVSLRAEVNRLYEDRQLQRSGEPDVKREVHHYHTGGAEK